MARRPTHEAMSDIQKARPVRNMTALTAKHGKASSPDQQDGTATYADLPSIAPGWWPVAMSSDLCDKPISVAVAETNLALYRDKCGVAHAVLDRCPHRRMPLSLGRITDDGLIQCGYHGWSFNGSGLCERIPNFRPGERPSGRIVVDAFPTTEVGGFILVHSRGDAQAPPADLLTTNQVAGMRDGVAVEVRSPHRSVVEALALNPGAALGLELLLGSGDEVVGPQMKVEPHQVVIERERLTLNLPRLTTFDAVVKHATRSRIEVEPVTGIASVTSELPHGGTVRVLIGASPIGAYRTTVRWRIAADGPGASAIVAAAVAACTLRSRVGRSPRIFEAVADQATMTYDPALRLIREGMKS